VTDSRRPSHSLEMLGVLAVPRADVSRSATADVASFETVYDTYFPYIWRSVQRLGVPLSQADDVVQEVFLVVYRRLSDFEGRSSLKTWLYGIALRVARSHRMQSRRSGERVALDAEQLRAPDATRPDERAENAEAARLVDALLDGLEYEQREVFVLAELEQLTAPEIAEALGAKLNTVYSRLRLARRAFAEAAARCRAQDSWRFR
jgi:RNA polymerase sigma-70 factor, ECF subfamily